MRRCTDTWTARAMPTGEIHVPNGVEGITRVAKPRKICNIAVFADIDEN